MTTQHPGPDFDPADNTRPADPASYGSPSHSSNYGYSSTPANNGQSQPPQYSSQSKYYSDAYNQSGHYAAKADHPNAAMILILGILGLFIPLVSFAGWYMGNKTTAEAKAQGYNEGGVLQIGRILSIILSVFQLATVAIIILGFFALFAFALV